MLKIGEFSKLSRISIRMLRHYDELGLLVPKVTDNFTGYRYYGSDQLPIAGRIVSMRDMGFGLVASVRKVIPAYEQEGMLWGILMGETASLNMADSDPCYTLAIFHDGEFKETAVDVEVQKSVKGRYSNTENVIFKSEPAVEIASATFKGGYEQTGNVNEAVAKWVEDNGYAFTGLAFNIYHVSPHETQNPDEYVTEVCYPVKKK